ncbi:MAG: tetratricopeptide repeat protein [Pseudomonadota bacterium]
MSRSEAEAPAQDRGAGSAYGAFQRGYYLTALQLALPRADAGDPAAQTLIAEIYWNGLGVARDRERAVEWYRFAADAGNAQAQFILGNLLLNGDGVAKDAAAGEELMKKAADQGHARASFNLAQIITGRRPTWASFKRALPLYEKAAEAGIADAQYALANIHAEAQGVPHNDDDLARKWLARAASNGLEAAQVELGIWMANGRGGAKDEDGAGRWFAQAAAKGNVLAQNRLARMNAFGIGKVADPIRAGAWHVLASRAGFSDPEMDRIFQSLSAIDKKRALEAADQLSARMKTAKATIRNRG